MFFSKSFGYALRGVLYVAMANEKKRHVHLDEIAEELAVPRYFLAKVMKTLVKEGVLNSMKGPYGGFCSNEKTRHIPLLKLVEITGEAAQFGSCVLRLRKCNAVNPCPLHKQVESLRKEWMTLLANTTIDDLLNTNQPAFIRSIATI